MVGDKPTSDIFLILVMAAAMDNLGVTMKRAGNQPHKSSGSSKRRFARTRRSLICLLVASCFAPSVFAAEPGNRTISAWPEKYAVQKDEAAGRLRLSTPYYTVTHDLKRGGAISEIRLTNGRATNLLIQPLAMRIETENGTHFTDLPDDKARVTHRQDGLTEIVTVESRLLDEQGRASHVSVRTVFAYHWGYLKIHRKFLSPPAGVRVREVCPVTMVLAPSLSDYGYREGITEAEGAPAFSFGSNRWGKMRRSHPADPPVTLSYVPRSLLFADAGVEGLEWFVSSDLSQWDLQLTGQRGQARSQLTLQDQPPGIAVAIAPFFSTNATVVLSNACQFDFYLGLPLKEQSARSPWLHTSFNRNRGAWVTPAQIQRWAESGIQTVHCHNDGDYYGDGLFWRDGSYPPYPDLAKFDQVLTNCHQAGLRTATYFSNKELHPSTPEFQEHGMTWGRLNRAGKLQHNFYAGTNEFGAQMCLRSGWIEFLKHSIDRVLENHPLDGVYYDWNVALYCANGQHEGKAPGEAAAGHWDIDELLDLMEWTRHRVGPNGLVIIHDTTTPMFSVENFSDHVVANEWGYGTWKDDGPKLEDLPLEWSLVGARSRGVISYGQLNAQSPPRLHRLFAQQALLSGVTPWPASPATFELVKQLKPLGDFQSYRFADWRNPAVTLEGGRCASAIYSRPGETYVLLSNLQDHPQEARCVVRPQLLPYPLPSLRHAALIRDPAPVSSDAPKTNPSGLEVEALVNQGVPILLPADGMVLLQLR